MFFMLVSRFWIGACIAYWLLAGVLPLSALRTLSSVRHCGLPYAKVRGPDIPFPYANRFGIGRPKRSRVFSIYGVTWVSYNRVNCICCTMQELHVYVGSSLQRAMTLSRKLEQKGPMSRAQIAGLRVFVSQTRKIISSLPEFRLTIFTVIITSTDVNAIVTWTRYDKWWQRSAGTALLRRFAEAVCSRLVSHSLQSELGTPW